MAKTHRFPIVIWKHQEGSYTARLLDDDNDGIAVAGSRKEALEHLKEYLLHLHKSIDCQLTHDFLSPKIRKLKVNVFPKYPDKRKTFACREPIKLHLPCITGERESGLLTALLPTIDYSFEFHDKDGFDELATHYVRTVMSGKTPQEVSRFLPPEEIELAEIIVNYRNIKSSSQLSEVPESLGAIADHLGSRDFKKLNRTWERETQVEALVRLLMQDGTNACLVGPSGCGKTSVLIDAAHKIEVRFQPESTGARMERLFWLSSAGRIISGMQWLGQWQLRCEDAIDDLSNMGGILCVENLLELLRVGGEAPESSVAAFLMPFLKNGELRIVCEASRQELDACDRLLPGFTDCLQIVELPPFDESSELRLLSRAADAFARNDKIIFSPAAIDSIHQLFRRFLPYASFPGKPSAFMAGIIEKAGDEKRNSITDAMVRDAFGKSTGLPERFLRDDIPLDLEETVTDLSARVIGQPEAIKRVAAMLMRFKAGVNDLPSGHSVPSFSAAQPVSARRPSSALSAISFFLTSRKKNDSCGSI